MFSFRSTGVKFHIANSAAVVNGIGTDLDYVRPGICMYGQPPGNNCKSGNFRDNYIFTNSVKIHIWDAKKSRLKHDLPLY